MHNELNEEVCSPAQIVLKDVPAPHDASSTITVYRRGDILPPELASDLPADALSPELLLRKNDVLFLLEEFDHERFENITVIPAGPPGSPRIPLKSEARNVLDVYGTCLNPDRFQTVVLRRKNGLYVKAS